MFIFYVVAAVNSCYPKWTKMIKLRTKLLSSKDMKKLWTSVLVYYIYRFILIF